MQKTIDQWPSQLNLSNVKPIKNMCVSPALQIHHPIQPSPKNGFANCARARPPGPLSEYV